MKKLLTMAVPAILATLTSCTTVVAPAEKPVVTESRRTTTSTSSYGAVPTPMGLVPATPSTVTTETRSISQ